MLRNFISGAVILFFWMVVGLFGLALLGGADEIDTWFVAVAIGAMALMGTLLFINERFELRAREPRTTRPQARTGGKRKRTDNDSDYATRVQALMAVMDAEERETFKAAMRQRLLGDEPVLGDDGEYPVDLEEFRRYTNQDM